MFSYRALQISPSATLAITARAKQMKKEGIDIISLAAGEPDFNTPDHIKNAANDALNNNFTKYTPTAGILELRQAICDKFKKDNQLDYQTKNILVSAGAKQCLFNIIQVLIDQNDEVLLPIPSWVSYDEMVKFAGGKCIYIKSPNLKVNSKLLEKHLTKKTKLLVLGTPSNPAGTVYEKEELEDIANFCVKNNVFIISDEVYEKLIYDKTHYSIANFNEKIKKLTITVNGFSKAYSMTGWRVGYCAAEEEIIKLATNLQDHSTSGVNSITQKAALAALAGPQDFLKDWVKEYKNRRNYMLSRLNNIPGLKPIKPDGAFYIFVDISNINNNNNNKNKNNQVDGRSLRDPDSVESRVIQSERTLAGKKLLTESTKTLKSTFFCQQLLEKAHVAAIPGAAFGDDNYIRLSFATSMENIKKALDRIESFVV